MQYKWCEEEAASSEICRICANVPSRGSWHDDFEIIKKLNDKQNHSRVRLKREKWRTPWPIIEASNYRRAIIRCARVAIMTIRVIIASSRRAALFFCSDRCLADNQNFALKILNMLYGMLANMAEFIALSYAVAHLSRHCPISTIYQNQYRLYKAAAACMSSWLQASR